MICFFGDDFSVIGGVETTTYNLQKQLLNRHGIKTEIFSLNAKMGTSEKFKTLSFDYKIKYFSILAGLVRIHRLGYDQIVTSYFAFNILNIIASKILGYKAIIQEHASCKSYSPLKLFFIFLFYRFADDFIVLNKFDCDFYSRMYLNPCIMLNCYIYMKGYHEVISRDYYLILSRLDDNKRVDLAIEAWKMYKANGGRYPLFVVGDGPCYKNLKAQYECSDIRFIGSVHNAHKYLCKARSLLITSKFECYPTVVVEGKFVGTPSIAFDVPSGLKEMINSEVDGILVPDGNCNFIAQAMLELDCDDLLSKMSRNAFISANEFDADKSAMEYAKLFES